MSGGSARWTWGSATAVGAVLLTLLGSVPARSEYAPFDFNWVQGSLFRGWRFPAVSGDAVDDTYLEFEGFHRKGLLDLYWFVDFADITNSVANDTHGSGNDFYTEIKPRLSLDGMLGRDLAVGPLREWFLAYELDLDDGKWGGGLEYHNVGIGTNVAVKGADYFQANLFARYVKDDYGNPSEGRWDGYLLNLCYGGPVKKLGEKGQLYWSGWLDSVFGASWSAEKPSGASHSFQWYNQLRFAVGRVGVSYAFKLNRSFAQVTPGPGRPSDTTAHILGLHVVLWE